MSPTTGGMEQAAGGPNQGGAAPEKGERGAKWAGMAGAECGGGGERGQGETRRG